MKNFRYIGTIVFGLLSIAGFIIGNFPLAFIFTALQLICFIMILLTKTFD